MLALQMEGGYMYLKNIKIENYRNLASVEVQLQAGLNAIVGPNNIGKTNLYSAIRHALGPSAARGESLWLTEEDIRRDNGGQPIDAPIRISLTFVSLNENQITQFFEILDIQPEGVEVSPACVHFEASWQSERGRFTVKRWGGSLQGERATIPNEILEALPITFLPALRDAEAALTPGNRSRLARLLQDFITREGGERHKDEIIGIYDQANRQLEAQGLIQETQGGLRESTRQMAGTEYLECAIRAAVPELGRIFRTLSISLENNPVSDISANGLGYNNLLYMATILAHLEKAHDDECPILLVEEPEAHLHPQMTVLLGEYLQERLSTESPPQAIVSTHSPVFVSNVKPSRICLMVNRPERGIVCNSLSSTGLTDREEKQLQRMLDVTRATLYFCKGLILVEGISEALLITELAKRLDPPVDLAKEYISVLPICGVSFGAFVKLFSPNALDIPVSIISDADPSTIPIGGGWEELRPNEVDGNIEVCPRAQGLSAQFEGSEKVRISLSQVTLEYDIADAGPSNPDIMAQIWEDSFQGRPQTFNRERLQAAGEDHKERVLSVWRGICKAEHSGSKAYFAHLLSEWLADNKQTEFAVPGYISDAIRHAQHLNHVEGGEG
jgi:putative ATP-dependent endonuclease of OLD family